MSKGKGREAELSDILFPHQHRKGRSQDLQFYSQNRPAAKEQKRQSSTATLKGLTAKAPEAMTKITRFSSGGAAAKKHLLYITRHGQLEIENDRGELMKDSASIISFIEEVKNDIDAERKGLKTRTLMHLMVSMPMGTDPNKVRNAAKNFACENFASNHDYGFVLHTDRAHPHVHFGIRTLGRDGKRLNPRKADLAEWRQSFAKWMRMEGVDAVATPRSVRGISYKADRAAIYHAKTDKKGDRSTQTAREIKDAAADILADLRPDLPVSEKLAGDRQVQREVLANSRAKREQVVSTLTREANTIASPRIYQPLVSSTMLRQIEDARKRVAEYERQGSQHNEEARTLANVHRKIGNDTNEWGTYTNRYANLHESRYRQLDGRSATKPLDCLRQMSSVDVVYKRGRAELLLLQNTHNHVSGREARRIELRRASASNGNVLVGAQRNLGVMSEDLQRYIKEVASKPITTRHQDHKKFLAETYKLTSSEFSNKLKQAADTQANYEQRKEQRAKKLAEKKQDKQTSKKDAHNQR